MERAAGIEPASPAWKAGVLPLHNARVGPVRYAEPDGSSRQEHQHSHDAGLSRVPPMTDMGGKRTATLPGDDERRAGFPLARPRHRRWAPIVAKRRRLHLVAFGCSRNRHATAFALRSSGRIAEPRAPGVLSALPASQHGQVSRANGSSRVRRGLRGTGCRCRARGRGDHARPSRRRQPPELSVSDRKARNTCAGPERGRIRAHVSPTSMEGTGSTTTRCSIL